MKLDKPLNLTFAQPAQKTDPQALQRATGSEAQQVEELKIELLAKNQLIEAKNQELNELKIKNRQLHQENQETQERQKLMDEELRKAEAQIELIMELMNDRNEESGE
ncbi:hypothetical protein [Marinobacter xiaoshiensis]|uniref:Cell division protein ZapB n=1 Tax=Marinobacter xiaoshiensis TaxID=3073652 RepID=A0ABU2HEH0_9GAMM|nr:hypothetical protein [Marinobacter sp. F60267]MDS1309457.1 hypothetical protein [Marinobacter sp. F60267]